MFQYEAFPESCTTQPAACSWAPNRINVFWRGQQDRLFWRWHDGVAWSMRSLPDTVPGEMAACSWGPDRIDLFWKEPSGALHHKWWNGTAWGDETIAATLASAPAVCSWGPNRLDLFWKEPSGALHHKWHDAGGWGDETFASSRLAGAPAACSAPGSGRIDVFWRSSSGSLMHRWYSRGWYGDEDLGGSFHGAPTACSWAPGVLDVLVRQADNTIGHRWYDEGWHNWTVRPGGTVASPCVTSWGDGRMDAFVAGTDGKLYHGWYQGRPVATRSEHVTTLWGFLRAYRGSDRIERLHNSFAVGHLSGNCGGAMISPHIFMTASHCAGPGYTGSVSFFRIDPFRLPPDHGSQQVTTPYAARAFPWQDSGIGSSTLHGDVVLWWLENGPNGVPPGIEYGYQEISGLDVEVGTPAYSFWPHAAIRLDSTLMYSSGVADARHAEDDGFLGRYTHYKMWAVGGASGSTNLVGDGGHSHRVVGVTAQTVGGEGPSRNVPDAVKFLADYDADRNGVIDAVDYDWLMTAPSQSIFLFSFDTPFRLSRWVAVPGGSATSAGARVGSLDGFPAMTGVPAQGGTPAKTDGYWNHFARFRARGSYRLSLSASGTAAPGRSSYVKFRSDRSNHEVRFDFTPQAGSARFTGRVTLGDHPDYRLILGTDADSSVVVSSLAIAAEGTPFGFATHDERRSWEYGALSLPTSWGTRGANSFGGAVVGPTTGPPGWGLRNRFLGLLPGTRYRIEFEVLPVRGAARAGACYARLEDLGGRVSGEMRWDFAPGASLSTKQLIATTGAGSASALVFGVDHDAAYVVGSLLIGQV